METLSGYLAGDHHHCDALMRRAAACIQHGQWPDARRAVLDFQGALERHLLIEERVLFPAFEQAFGDEQCPTRALRVEHLRIRGMAQRLVNAVQETDRHAFATHAEVLLLTMHQHGEKEEGVLYPMIERVLGARCKDVVAAMRAFGNFDTCAGAA